MSISIEVEERGKGGAGFSFGLGGLVQALHCHRGIKGVLVKGAFRKYIGGGGGGRGGISQKPP